MMKTFVLFINWASTHMLQYSRKAKRKKMLFFVKETNLFTWNFKVLLLVFFQQKSLNLIVILMILSLFQLKAYSKYKLVSSSFDGTMKVWNVDTGMEICPLRGETPCFRSRNLWREPATRSMVWLVFHFTRCTQCMTINQHFKIAMDLQQSFLWLHPTQAEFAIFLVQTYMLMLRQTNTWV